MTRTFGMVGLGRMGGNMSRRIARAGLPVVAWDAAAGARAALANEPGVTCTETLEAMVEKLAAPRIVWLMLPAGAPTEATLQKLVGLLARGDIVVDGANAMYRDSQRHARELAGRGLQFIDAGVSGGVWGLVNGYGLMVGGDEAAVREVQPVLAALAPAADRGWVHCGKAGAGHYAKMVHNGIEYGMMQAIAEGFALLRGKPEFALDLGAVGALWQEGSVIQSWLLDLTAAALADPGALESVAPFVADSGEGRWTIDEAIRQGTPAPVIALALMSRFDSQGRADVANRLLALMRKGFGGHEPRKAP